MISERGSKPHSLKYYIQEGVSLVPYRIRDSSFIIKDCIVYFYDKDIKEFQSFSADKIACQNVNQWDFLTKRQYEGFVTVSPQSIVEIQNIHSKNIHKLTKFESFVSRFYQNKCKITKNFFPTDYFIESKPFDLIIGGENLAYWKPPA
mmetsp:Transcript_13501/g.13429  ORF Transcript_13501/g.13429 Transcript_13501/m.13429 type:complete len:148 (+) Transcript_13501:346-789(+)